MFGALRGLESLSQLVRCGVLSGAPANIADSPRFFAPPPRRPSCIRPNTVLVPHHTDGNCGLLWFLPTGSSGGG